jgi:hypothetical protein
MDNPNSEKELREALNTLLESEGVFVKQMDVTFEHGSDIGFHLEYDHVHRCHVKVPYTKALVRRVFTFTIIDESPMRNTP